MKKFGWVFALAVLLVFVLAFGKTTFMSGLIYNFSNHMLSWLLGIVFTISLIIFLTFAMGESEFRGKFFRLASISGILWIVVLIF